MAAHLSSRIAVAVAASASLAAAAAFGQGVASAAAGTAPAAAAGHPEKVIVVLRDQLRGTPARSSDMAARTAVATQTQDAVLARLPGAAPARLRHFALANAFAATVTRAQATELAADPAVASVVKDVAIPMPDAAAPAATSAPATTAHGAAATHRSATTDNPFAICPTDPAQPLLEPEALSSMHALTTDGSPDAQQLTTGKGVKVAYIADGIDPDNPNFIRPDGQHAIVDYQDFSGEGPDAPSGGGEAFGDASSIAAQGTVTYDLSDFVNQAHPLPAGCNIRIVGVAPGASIVALKAGGEFLTNSSILQSIDYAVRVDDVNVINESFGLNQFPDNSNRNTIKLFNDQAVKAGVTITESTGDGGVTGTIGSDAQDPKVISVGASTDSRLYAQTTYAAEPFSNGKWLDDNISALSSSGFTQFGRTLDVVAPGEANWATCEPGFSSCVNFQSPAAPSDIEAFGGTSESAPLTAGVAALVISAYRSTHQHHSPPPAVVKRIITGTAADLGLPPDEQGAGLVDARAATEAALTWPRAKKHAPAGVRSHIVTSTDQLTLSALPGTQVHKSVTVTNVGDQRLHVAAGTRRFAPLAESTQAFSFDSTTLPTFSYYNGQAWAFKKVTFHVPAGAARLVTRMAWAGSHPPAADAVVRVSLFAPDGSYVADSRPQGGAATSNYANVDVRKPAEGTWTAVVYSVAGSAGYDGVIGLDAMSQQAVPVGSVTPATFWLKPGASKHVTMSMRMPTVASGDQSDALTLATSKGQTTAVAAVVRTLVPAGHGKGRFIGEVTGGNARQLTPGQTLSYAVDVPKGKPSLSASVRFADPTDSVVDLVLIDPHGELADVASNIVSDQTGSTLSLSQDIQSFTADPLPGRWHLVVVVQNPVSGTAFTQPFTGRVGFGGPVVRRGGLPHSASTRLTQGKPTTYRVKVTNTGVQPILVGADPRRDKQVSLQPVPIQGQSTFDLPPDPSQEPTYTIPPDTTRLKVAASSTTPAQLELQGSAAGFDLFGSLAAARHGDTLSVTGVHEKGGRSFISKGVWFTNMQQIGPFDDDGAPAGSTTIFATMQTLGFDHDVTSSTGDPYGNSVDPDNNGFGTPVQIAPGSSQVITVTIEPTRAKGTTVSGVLNLVTVPNLPSGSTGLPEETTGEVIAALPYRYTVR